jgi:7-cyano-7-deazaguanosine (preQ0) biosynthesis protein QueE
MKVNEIFGKTIQGEGKSAGKEVMFLRLAGCNLHCIWCDTPYTWNWVGTNFSHPQKYDKAKEVVEMNNQEIISKLIALGGEEVKALVVSGGEPLIQQRQLIPLFKSLKLMGWWIEVETNGTIPPLDELIELADQINCSPKLANSDNEARIRIKGNAMRVLASTPKTYFKFVISSSEDEQEVEDYINNFELKQVYLMPLGMTKDQLNETRSKTQELVEKMGVMYSERIHITLLGGGRAI